MTNVLWAHIGGSRYAFTYNHDLQAIEIRRDNLRGYPVARFDNTATAAEIKQFFGDL